MLFSLVGCLMIGCSSSHGDKGDKLRADHKWNEAVEEYKAGAEKGEAYSMWRLSKAYAKGEGIEFDNSLAQSWLNKAVEAQSPEAQIDLARLKILSSNASEHSNGVQEVKAMEGSSDNPYVIAQIARLYWDGVEPDFPANEGKAVELLNSIAVKEEPMYFWLMGFVKCYGGSTLEVYEPEAIRNWQKSYELGGLGAPQLANLYWWGGNTTPKDWDKAVDWYKKGVEANNAESMYQLAVIYANQSGEYTKYEDRNKALDLVQKAVKHGSRSAADLLSRWYEEGFIVTQDEAKSTEYKILSSHLSISYE